MSKGRKKHIHEKTNKRKIIISVVLILIIIVIGVSIFIKNNKNVAKTSKIGKNSSSQEIVDYILNISSYEAEIDVETKSNKNSNKYKIKQTYINNENNIQEVIEPSNIQGVRIIKEGRNLKIENTRLSLTKIIENYSDITQNNLDLNNFIENYKNNLNSKFREENNQIIMETTVKTESNYQKYEILYISKGNGKPIKMEIKDTNQNMTIYIIYNEIKINEVSNRNVYAFRLFNVSKEI